MGNKRRSRKNNRLGQNHAAVRIQPHGIGNRGIPPVNGGNPGGIPVHNVVQQGIAIAENHENLGGIPVPPLVVEQGIPVPPLVVEQGNPDNRGVACLNCNGEVTLYSKKEMQRHNANIHEDMIFSQREISKICCHHCAHAFHTSKLKDVHEADCKGY